MNTNLEKVIRVLNHRSLLEATNNKELARLSGLTTKTITRSKADIDTYAKTAPIPSVADELSIDKKIVENYIDVAANNTKIKSKYFYSNILGAAAGYILRQETNLINNVNQPLKVINIGIAFMRLASQIKSKKNSGEGRPIHSKSKLLKYLLEATNNVTFVDKLFKRSDSYKTGKYSKVWSLTAKGEEVVEEAVNKTVSWLGSNNVPVFPEHIRGYICGGKSGTSPLQPPICFTISLQSLPNMSLISMLHILNHSEPSSTPGYINVTLENLSSTDETLGRDYNIFTRLRSAERKALGYINYDISGGIQIISFSILYKNLNDPNLFEKYPMLFNYAHDPAYKQDLRVEVSKALNISIDDVKSLLTAYANGSDKNSDKHPKLKEFAEESDLLRKEVIAITAEKNPDILAHAQNQSKKSFPDDLDWMAVEEEDPQLSRDKASVYFFIWTWYEKQIRDAMLSLVSDGIPVHDAVYSKQKLPCTDFEDVVLKQTGFEVKISH